MRYSWNSIEEEGKWRVTSGKSIDIFPSELDQLDLSGQWKLTKSKFGGIFDKNNLLVSARRSIQMGKTYQWAINFRGVGGVRG